MFWAPLLLGAMFGGLKSGLDAAGRDSDKQVQAETTRMSPWTNMKAAEPRQVDTVGNLLKGGLSGAMIGSIGQNAGWWDLLNKGGMGGTAGASPLTGMMNRTWPGMEP